MRHYHFTEHNGSQTEDLGGVVLDDDDEALAFGKQLIRDLMDADAEHYAGRAIDITEGEGRIVGPPSFRT